MNYIKLEQCKINLKSHLKECKCERMKKLIKHDIEIIEKKRVSWLGNRSEERRVGKGC